MASLAHYALPGIIVLASAGAFLMCLLVIRYGFTPLEEDPEDAGRRLFLTRLGHAAAAVCFAGAALLAAAAVSARGAPAPVAARGADADTLDEVQARLGEQAREIARLTEALHRRQLDVEGRLAAAESAPSRTERVLPAAERPLAERARPAAERSEATVESRRRPAEARTPTATRPLAPADGDEAALPAGAPARTVTATLEGVRDVSLHGQTPDGRPVQTTLLPASEPGVHRGRLPNIARDLRLRVAGPGTRFEVSLAGETRW